MELRKVEDCKIECAKKFFSKITSDQVKYDVVDGVGEIVYSHAFMPKNPATGSLRHPFGKARNARCARVGG
jgi:restriction endonuclease